MPTGTVASTRRARPGTRPSPVPNARPAAAATAIAIVEFCPHRGIRIDAVDPVDVTVIGPCVR